MVVATPWKAPHFEVATFSQHVNSEGANSWRRERGRFIFRR